MSGMTTSDQVIMGICFVMQALLWLWCMRRIDKVNIRLNSTNAMMRALTTVNLTILKETTALLKQVNPHPNPQPSGPDNGGPALTGSGSPS